MSAFIHPSGTFTPTLTARPYQRRAICDVRASFHAGHRAIVVVLPTGGGKTFVATQLALPVIQKGLKVQFIVHRDELAAQAIDSFRKFAVIPGRHLEVVSLQTAVARGLQLSPALAICDECHHLAADAWSVPIQSMRDRGIPMVGLTATPDRADGRGLAPLFDDIVVGAQPRELIGAGHLVPCRVISPAAPRKSLAEHPVRAYQKYGKGSRCIVFARDVAHAKRLAHEFTTVGIRARFVEGAMPAADRRVAIDMFRGGRIDVLVNVQVLTEGFDVPETSTVITCTGGSSAGALIQKVGRGMRPAPGKAACLHLDLRGAWLELGMLPGDDRHFSLTGRAITGAAKEYGETITRCRKCGCLISVNEYRHSTCPYCGFIRPGKPDPRIRRAAMARIADREVEAARVDYMVRQYFEVHGRRKKNGEPYRAFGYALQRFNAKYRRRATESEIQKFRERINAN